MKTEESRPSAPAGRGERAQPYWHQRTTEETTAFLESDRDGLTKVLAIRSERRSLWSLGLRTNLPLLGAVALTFALQLAIVYVPALRIVFKTVPLSAADLAVCIGSAAVILGVVEAEKFIRRPRAHGRRPAMRAAVGRAVMWSDAKLPRGLRSLLGLVLIVGGLFGFLPILGFWMVPLGGALIALDIPPLRRRLFDWLDRHRIGRPH